MFSRRMLYVAVLMAVVTFHMVYTAFDSYLLLLSLLLLPVLSLAVSLPAMLRVRVRLPAPACARRGAQAQLAIHMECAGPLPVGGLRLRLRSLNRLTGEEPYPPRVYLAAGGSQTVRLPIDTAHCGCLVYAAARVRVLDHLGLIALPVRRCASASVTVLPVAAAPDPPPELPGLSGGALRPKPGGGFAEEHELRPYRAGDPLVSIHWKLSSKLDALVVREAMEPQTKPLVLSIGLGGPPDALDAALAELAWLSGALCARHVPHVLQWRDGEGKLASGLVTGAPAFERLLRRMLARPAAERPLPPPPAVRGRYHVAPAPAGTGRRIREARP